MDKLPVSQIPIQFEKIISFKKEDFILSPSNEDAFDKVFHQEWISHGLILLGDDVCGKTHLAKVWSDENKAVFLDKESFPDFQVNLNENESLVIDDIDLLFGSESSEEKLFHLYNLIKEMQGKMLLTTKTAPASWKILLPDLSSRLKSLPVAMLHKPDEFLLKAVLLKLFSDRQISIGIDIVDYIVPRIDRSMKTLIDFAQMIDEKSLSDKRNITIPFVKNILDNREQEYIKE